MTFIKNRAVHLVAAAVVLATSTAFADGKTKCRRTRWRATITTPKPPTTAQITKTGTQR